MKNKLINYKKSFLLLMSLFIVISVAGFTGCSFKENTNSQVKDTSGEQVDTTQDTSEESSSDNESAQDQDIKNDSETETKPTAEEDPPTAEEANPEDNNITQLISLIGLNKEELASAMKEASKTVDEGGLEFTEYGIRVWFDENSLVNQIYLMNNKFNLNNVKIGDKISAFQEAFGDPVSDNNGDAHFQYENIFLSVNYDTTTKDTYAVYLLKNDF